MTLGIVESLTATFYGPSWSPAVAFGFLLLTLAVRPSGMFGRCMMRNPVFVLLLIVVAAAGVRRRACDRQRLCVLRRLRRAAIHRAGDGLEHPGRLHRLREFRHRGVLRLGAYSTVVLHKLCAACRCP